MFTKVATATVAIPEAIFGSKGSERILAFPSTSAPASAGAFDTALASSWVGVVQAHFRKYLEIVATRNDRGCGLRRR